MNKPYNEYGEIFESVDEAAEFCGVGRNTFFEWLYCGKTPMGALIEGTHYYRINRGYRFIKYQLALLFKMIGS